MRIEPATEAQQAAMEAFGLRLAEQARAFVRSDGTAPLGSAAEHENTALGRTLILALFSAANDTDWLNRVWLLDGIGHAIGEAASQMPGLESALLARLSSALSQGRMAGREAFEPKGNA